MASTTFIDQQTVIYAAWLNDVNNAVYNGTFPNGVLNPTTLNATNIVSTNATITNLTVTNFTPGPGNVSLPNNWAINATASKLYFNYNGTNVASLDTSGNFISLANTTAGGTP
jgi:hypothetical protein